MSKGRSGTQQVTSYNIPDDLLQNQRDVFQAAQDFNPAVFTGDRFAAVNPYEAQQIQSLSDFGGDMDTVNLLEGTLGGLLAGNVGQPDLLRAELDRDLSSEYLNRVIDDRLADTTNQITSQYSRAGRLGSDAFGSALGRGIGTAVAPLLADNERQEAERRANLAARIIDAERGAAATQLAAASAIPQTQNLALQRIAGIGTAGDLQRAMDERSILAQQQQIAEENAAAAARLNALVTAGGQGNLGVGSTTTTYGRDQGLGGSLLGAGLLARSLLTPIGM